MSYLSTAEDQEKFFNGCLIFFTIMMHIIMFLVYYSESATWWQNLLHPYQDMGERIVLCMCWIANLLTLILWYPAERRWKEAMAHGKVYEGKIMQTLPAKWNASLYSPCYQLRITYETEQGECEMLSPTYVGSLHPYIPMSGICKVYVYKGKPYLDRFYEIKKTKPPLPKKHMTPEEMEDYLASLRELTPDCLKKNESVKDYLTDDIENLPKMNRDEMSDFWAEFIILSSIESRVFLLLPPQGLVLRHGWCRCFTQVEIKSKHAYRGSLLKCDYPKVLEIRTEEDRRRVEAEWARVVEEAIYKQMPGVTVEKVTVRISRIFPLRQDVQW